MIAQYLAAYTYIPFGLYQLLFSLQPSFTTVSAGCSSRWSVVAGPNHLSNYFDYLPILLFTMYIQYVGDSTSEVEAIS